MISDYNITRISDGSRPAVHSYYDICPEQPSGDRVLLSVWDSTKVPGAARVAIGDVAGGPLELIGEPARAVGHTGRYPIWMDTNTIAYHRGIEKDAAGWCTRDLSTGVEVDHPGGLRQFDIQRKQGLVLMAGGGENPNKYRQEVRVIDRDGKMVSGLTVKDAKQAHAAPETLPACEELNFMNAKWSYDGTCFFVVFTDEIFLRGKPGLRDKFKCLIVTDADGSNVRFLQDFTHHPHWSPDSSFAFAVMAVERAGKPSQDICAFDLETGVASRLLANVASVHPTILPDGKTLIIDEFHSPVPGQAQIVRWDLESAKKEVLVRCNHADYGHANGHHPHPVPSRDGRRIYFNAQDEGICQVYALDLT